MLRWRSLLLVVLATSVLVEVMRVSFPLLYDLAGRVGFTTATWLIPLLFCVPLLAAPLTRWVNLRVLLTAGIGGLAVVRVIMQIQSTPGVVITLVGLFVGVVALGAALRVAVGAHGGATTSMAFFLGLTLDAAIRLALVTWDAAWQSSPFAWIVGVGLPFALVVVLLDVVRGLPPEDASAAGPDAWWLAAMPGPVLALQTLFLGNPAFVASSGQVDLWLAGLAVVVGLTAAAMMPSLRGMNLWIARIWLVAVAATLTGPTGMTGLLVLVLIVLGQLCVGALVAGIARRAELHPPGHAVWHTGFGAGVGALLLVGVLLPYQISYEIPLGVPQFVFPVIGGVALVALAGRGTERRNGGALSLRPGAPRLVAAAGGLLACAVPGWLALTGPEPQSTDREEVRIVTYNIHSAIDTAGRLDPEAIAQVVEGGGAEVMMLQEVARGWPLAGGLDTASWLGRRLGADVAYGPAADSQFGNAVVSTMPIRRMWGATLDQGEGTMRRGYVGAEIEAGAAALNVWSTHLQHQDHTTATRIAQAEAVLATWERWQTPSAIFGGDLNSRPGSPDIQPWFAGTGLVSAQDEAGDPDANTAPSVDPHHRIDWIFGTEDVVFSDVEIPPTLASDHLPVFATVTVDGG